MALGPAAFFDAAGVAVERPADGGKGWDIAGEFYPDNPAKRIGHGERAVIALWDAARGGEFGAGPLPDTGGVNDQSAWLLDALRVVGGAHAALTKNPREG